MTTDPAAPGLPATPGEFSRLSVLIATCFVDMVGFAIVLPILPFYALRLQATPETVGWLVAAFSIAQLVSAPLWGRVSDRSGRRPVLMIGLTASAVAYVVFGLADSLWLLFLSRFVQGAGGGMTGVAQAYVADTVAPESRAKALGWLSAATSAGVMIGPAIGSFATRLGPAAPGFVAAGLCLVSLGLAWRRLPESRRPDPEGAGAGGAPPTPIWHAAWQVVRHPTTPTSRMILIYATGMLAFTAFTSVVALFLAAEYGFTERTIGWVFLYVGGLSFVLRSLALGPIVRRLGEPRALRLGTVALITGLMLYPVVDSLWLLAALIPLMPIGTALLFPSTTSLLSKSAGPRETGLLMGVAQTFAGLARVAAPVGATVAFQRLGHGWPFWLAGGVVALVGVLALGVGRGDGEAVRR